jgi:hypothetical protein
VNEELRARLDALDREQLEYAFLSAVRGFAQYAEDRNDVPARIVNGFAIGFVQDAARPRCAQVES